LTRAFFGPGTRQAVLLFQKQNNLPATGAIDPATAERLARAQAQSRSAPRPDGSPPASSIPVAPRAFTARPISPPSPPTPPTAPSTPPFLPSTTSTTPSTTPIPVPQMFSVSGQVRGADGVPISGMRVLAEHLTATSSSLPSALRLGEATTDA